MRFLPFIAAIFVALPVHAKSVPTECVQVCPQVCITREMAMLSKIACMPHLDKHIDRCAEKFGKCERTSKESCEWRATTQYKHCLKSKA